MWFREGSVDNRFVVDLSGLELSDDDRKEMNERIQKVALEMLVKKKLPSPVAVRFPIDWLGIVVNPDFEHAAKLDTNISEKLKGV
jgi:hypothetical protein